MGIFQQFPYTNFHEMNLDQIIKIMRDMQDEWEDTKTEWASYKDFIDNYFNNLDLDQETYDALIRMVNNGTFNDVVDPVIASATAAWLADNIGPTTPAIDASLTVSGAGADAAVTGDYIRKLNNYVVMASNNAFNILNPTWEQGGLNTNGDVTSPQAIRTDYIDIQSAETLVLYVPTGYLANIYYYNNLNEYVARVTNITAGTRKYTVNNRIKCRLVLTYTPLANIPVSEGSKLTAVTWRIFGSGYDIYPTYDTTDRANDIATALSHKSTCMMAPGDYYVSTLVLQPGQELVGSGRNTRLIKTAGTYNYMLRAQQDCQIRDMAIYGSLTDVVVASGWDLNDTPANPCCIRIEGIGSDPTQRFRILLHNLYISSFNGAAIFDSRTGQDPQGGDHIDNIFIRNCNAGIVLGAYSEFNQVTECSVRECYYGTVNQGGNNIYTNCDFSMNTQALLMDDSLGIYQNNSHGVFVGCSFNHNDNNTGKAMELIAMMSGQVFSACNFFYGSINITGSRGIVFDGCNFGSSTAINVTNPGGVAFNGCAFRYNQSPVTLVNNNGTHFDNCRYMDGVLITGTPQ